MYKLTVVSGPNRGATFAIKDGETHIGRLSDNAIVLPSSRISKHHCVIVSGLGELVLRDSGSANGTFVNGVLVKEKTLRVGDRVSVGEYVFEISQAADANRMPAPALGGLVQPRTASRTSASPLDVPGMGLPGVPAAPAAVSANASMNAALNAKQMPTDLKGKVFWYFENQIMPIFYGLTMKYEWKFIALAMFGVMVAGSIMISIYPLMESSRVSIVKESKKRARFMARQIAERNAPALAINQETKTEIGLAQHEDDVRMALLTDLDNRILAPSAKMNQYLTSGLEANFMVRVRDLYRKGRETGVITELDANTVAAIEPVKVMSTTAGRNVVVALAIVSVDTSLATPDIGEIAMNYSVALIITGVLAGVIMLILYRMTLKPFQVLNDDMDRVLKGDIPQVTHEFKILELNPLWEVINAALQRVPKGANAAGFGGNASMDGAGAGVEDVMAPLQQLGQNSKVGLVLCDGDRRVAYMNSFFEEISGFRADAAQGLVLAEMARDQGMSAFFTDIFDRAPVGTPGIPEDFDFSGSSFKIAVTALGAPGASARGYVLTAVKGEG